MGSESPPSRLPRLPRSASSQYWSSDLHFHDVGTLEGEVDGSSHGEWHHCQRKGARRPQPASTEVSTGTRVRRIRMRHAPLHLQRRQLLLKAQPEREAEPAREEAQVNSGVLDPSCVALAARGCSWDDIHGTTAETLRVLPATPLPQTPATPDPSTVLGRRSGEVGSENV